MSSPRAQWVCSWFFLLGLTASTLSVDVPLDCQPGWTNIGSKCYRLFQDVLPWESADMVCQSYGSRLLEVKDYYENEDIGKFVNGEGATEYWIGASRRNTQTTNERALQWSDGEKSTVAVGYWQDVQPDTESGKCVMARLEGGRAVWSLAPCERKTPYVCQRPAAPQGSFHCHNGRFVRQGLTCDGDDDCGDGSDELSCSNRCSFHIRNQLTGTVRSLNSPNVYPNKRTCIWLIELQLGYNVRLQFTDFKTESRLDEVQILTGGMTVPTSQLVARLSGNLSTPLPSYTSRNNLMMIVFTTDDNMSDRGFSAQFSAVKDQMFPVRKNLVATNTPTELVSPMYPSYLGSQDYTWIIKAETKVNIVTLEIVEVDLKGDDKILIRDGDMVYDELLAELTSTSPMPPYVLSTGRNIYITMQTRGQETGKGFKFNYWQGCTLTLKGPSGEIHSPGYRSVGGQYGAYQVCTFDVYPGSRPITVRVNRMKLHPSDELMVYKENTLLLNVTGTGAPVLNITGSFRVIFDSDAIRTDEGFSISYSVACDNPQFNDKTVVTPPTTEYKLGTKVTISCKIGYAFSAVEFQDLSVQDGFEPLKQVELECMAGGTWNVRTLPLCEPRYCGQAPAVPNAYVVQATGVTYMDTVRYRCYQGFAMQGQDTIMCTDTGGWTNTPSCLTAACITLPKTILSGLSEIKAGDGTNFGSIVEYVCQPGYQIIGDPILFCTSDGRWSASVPICEVLKCYVPSVPNGYLSIRGNFIDVGQTVTASCNEGYISNVPGGGSADGLCHSDRSLTGLDSFECTYQDKCLSQPNYCTQLCHDSEFENRTCSCKEGFTLAPDNRTCENINECENNTAGCDHTCQDTPNGYQCSCDPGYILFTFDGTNGYRLAHDENGKRPGDVRRLNHTCLPKLCPNPPFVSNGNLMVNLSSYHYGDSVEYICNLGFKLSGYKLLTCNQQGQWDRTPPRCDYATCPPDTIPPGSVRNPATVFPRTDVGLGETVTLTCNVPGMAVFNKTRECVFYEGKYQLMGDDYECGLIDCGQPPAVSGSLYSGVNTSHTTYGAKFRFGCQNLYTPNGRSQSNDLFVRCLQDRRWDFGSLRCEGMRCQDPGTPPDGSQVNTTSYDQGDLVYYECDKDGFTPDNPYPLLCRLNSAGNGLEWNSTVPNCIDTQKPVFRGCPNETVYVNHYSRANTLHMPTATDNVHVSKIRITNSGTMDVWFSSDLILDRIMQFIITATDPSGNTATCNMIVGIVDDVPPTNECPSNMVKEFTSDGQRIQVLFTPDLLNISDDSSTSNPIFTPSSVDFTVSQAQLQPTFPPFRSYEISAKVTDMGGNPTTCNFELMIRPESCSPYSLRTPLHGQKTCQTLPGDRVQCELACDDGYVFYEMPGNASVTYTCTRGDDWLVHSSPACVRANDSSQQADFRQTFRFVFNKDQSVPCTNVDLYKSLLQKVLTEEVTPLLGQTCFITGVIMGGVLSVTDIVDLNNQVDVNITLAYDRSAILCNESVRYNFGLPNGEITRPLRSNKFTPIGCPAISTSSSGVLEEAEFYCTTGKRIEYRSAGASTSNVCVVCPEGTRTVGITCELCPAGTFNPLPGRTACNDCPAGTSTFRDGAVSNGECTAMCPAGRYSLTGLSPCKLCPKNTYSINNSTFCTPCPDGHITRQAGSTAPEKCLPPCAAGTYNPVDGHGDPATLGCLPCPRNYYSESVGSRQCSQCDLAKMNNMEGTISASSCIEHTGCNASNNPCQNNGNCHIFLHSVVCECPDGYNGQFCEKKVSPCSSSPCYHGAQCSVNGDTYSCNCPADSHGNRCELLTPFCNPNKCRNGGACRNDLSKATCLCKAGYSGSMCEQTQPICQPSPCFNGGTCVSHENVRYHCECREGYGGPTCNVNLNNCAPNPCLHGGNCTDLVNDFLCSCPNGFSGKKCETRHRLCDTVTCNEGQCVEDHEANTYRCVCPEGSYSGSICQYEAYFGYDVNGSAAMVYESNNASIEECKARCEVLRCREFIYDNSSTTCRIVDPRQGVSVKDGGAIYYHRVCIDVKESYWTPWYDSFLPGTGDQSGDDEMLSSLNMFGLNICDGTEPVDAQCQVVRTQAPSNETLFINCSPTEGLLCFNINQTDKQCENYEIRFKCLSSRVFSRTPCRLINYCSNSSTCLNGGSCRDTPTGPNCTCASGYSGSRCQHNRDDCASNPCHNNGKCVDQFGGYRCDCLPGFDGIDCSVNVNECLSNPCSIPGTESCQDGVNSFQCVCKPGYTGHLCELDIDDCKSQPCLHRGICVNQQNNFTCNCSGGWTGHTCETKVEKCELDTCSHGATCHNLFNDFYCGCLPNTFGKTCSNAPSICDNANPCLHGSTCSETKGMASCECPLEYAGDGCEFRRDVCSVPGVVCKNGATCSSTLQNFTCDCPPGYTGRYCEQNIDDCQFNTCPGNTCIDLPNRYICRCPVGRAGDNCEKEVNREFDLLFNEPEKNNMAAMPYALNLTGDGFSITMWVQYKQKGGQGTFFTMYEVGEPSSLSEKRELIRLDENTVTLSLNQTPIVLNTTVDYNEDGMWHYIVLSWNKTSGRFSFFVDTIRIPLNNYETGQPLSLNVWMVLGCRYNVSTDTCIKNEGINGYISQVSLYNRELIFKDELTILGNRHPFHVFPDAVMTWGEFLLYPGVTRVYPSNADRSCPYGFTGYKTCTTPVPGKTTVNVDHNSCPRDIIKFSRNRVTKVSWPDISFNGQAGQVRSSLSTDTVFLWGKYPVVVEAANDDGNKALCTFDIYVQYDQCTTPKTPVNAGQVFCANFTDVEQRGYRQCSVSCQPNHRVVVPSPKIHTCGPVGSWDPPNRYLPYTLPPCGSTSAPERRLRVVIVYNVPSGECDQVTTELRSQIKLRLQQQNSGWSSGLCKKTDCEDIKLEFKCDSNAQSGKRRKRQASNTRIEVTMTAEDVPSLLTSTSNSFTKISPEDLLQQLVLSDTVFDFTNRIADARPDPNGLEVKIELQCPAPKALIADQCVTCAAGSFYNNGTCSMCAIGSYQPLPGQTYCVPCTSGTTTETVGSVDSTQCKRVCDPGQYYSNEYDNCAPCPQGFYQNVSGLFYCWPCPVDKTTRQTGAKSADVCFNDCPPGEELAEDGTCTPCAIGFYKPGDQTLCGACDTDLVTNATGADSKDDCNVADNQAGFYRTKPDETQKAPCPIGTYQPEKWQYDCISCGEGYRTDTMGSISKDQCKFFCPAGQEKDRTMDKCIPCAIGFFRTGENPYSTCEVCPNNTRTMTTGSKAESDCTIYKCSAGYRPTQNQESCEKCPRGTYQPQNDQTDCLPCLGTMMDTRTDGATEQSQCEKYCESGYEKAENGTCVICPIGYYKSNTIDKFHTCTRCSDTRYVTPAPGATADTDCKVLNCQAGYRIRGTLCEPCPQGSYQDNPYKDECILCASGQSTRHNTSTLATDCETYCDPGKEKIGNECKICQRGYYKNNLKNVFMDCTLCPTEYVTPSLGSFTMGECTVRNCTKGQFIDGDSCSLCNFGEYQPDPWQSSCISCDKDRTTQRKGADNVTECILSCPPGKENKIGSNICTECQQGTFKSREEASLCDPCPMGYTTRVNGSVSQTDCELRACEAGSYAIGNECRSCPFGEYQPLKWQEQCIQCDDGFTTYQRGADSSDVCYLDCKPGQEYNNATKRCTPCSRGYYNDDLDPSRFTCIRCPIDFITAGTGATSDRNCSVRNCTVAGEYLDSADNVCRKCPRGQWQNQKWQTSCVACNVSLTTRYTGSSSKDDCLYDCPAGKRLDQGKNCINCPKGSYRNRSESWECDPCATGLTTPGTGASSRMECSISTCDKGYYFNNKQQIQTCERCPKNSYQDVPGKFTCKPCPERTETRQPGATRASDCIDRCKTTSNTCDPNARCASTPTGVICVCNDGYLGDGHKCTDVCEAVGYCKNKGVCVAKKCICKQNYEGDRCELRIDPQKAGPGEKDIIIIAVVTTLGLLLFIILLIVCCCVMSRKRQRNKVPFHNETSDERASIATRMSTRGYDDFGTAYGTKAPSVATGNRMMLPAQAQQMYENPTYTVNDGDPAVYKV